MITITDHARLITIIKEDDASPDAIRHFYGEFERHMGCSMNEFMTLAVRFTDESTLAYRLGGYCLARYPDAPYWTLSCLSYGEHYDAITNHHGGLV
tara:strand:+ start:4576 stop:4863 length:288 start_codon:yes stop_codon:yes gene_type:complete